MSEKLGRVAFETWERLIKELDSDGDAFDWDHMLPVGQQVWSRTAEAVRDAVIATEFGPQCSVVVTEYLRALERLAHAHMRYLEISREYGYGSAMHRAGWGSAVEALDDLRAYPDWQTRKGDQP